MEAARADRDSLLTEIQALREELGGHDASTYGQRSLTGVAKLSWEQEKNELRATIARKDDNIDKLLTDLASEKLSRTAMERLAESQMAEYTEHIELLER